MKKKIVTVLTSIMALSLLTSCGSSESVEFAGTPIDYKNLTVEEPELIAVTDEDIELALESLLYANMLSTEVTDRAVETGDVVNIDYIGYMDGEAFDGGSAEAYDLTIGSGSFIDGFEDGLIGTNIGDEVSLELTFPEDYYSEEMSGAEVVFEVVVNSISIEVLPELTDELIQEVSDTCTTIEEYEEELRATYEEENLATQLESKKTQVWSAVVEGSTVDEYPEDEINTAIDYLNEMYELQASYYGMTLEEFIEASGITTDEYNEYIEQAAQQSYISDSIIAYIGAEEGLTPTVEEYDAEIEELYTLYGYEDADSFLEAMSMTREEVEAEILLDVVLDWLVENVTFVEATTEDTTTEEVTE